MIRLVREPVIACAIVAALAGPIMSADAAPVTLSAVADAGVGYDENPFFVASGSGSGASAYVRAGIAPRLSWKDELSEAALFGGYHHYEYFRRFGSTDDYNINGSYRRTITERLSGHAQVGFSSAVTPLGDIFRPGNIPDEPVALPDIATATGQQRTKSINANGGFTYTPDARSTWQLGGQYSHSTYSGSRNLSDYTQYGGNFGYMRSVSERLSLGASVNVSRVESQLYDNSDTLQPTAQFQWQPDAHTTLNGSVGASITRTRDFVTGGRKSNVGLYVDLTGCRKNERSNICLTLARSVQPSGIGGLRQTTSATLTGSHSLSEHTRLTGNAAYGRYSGESDRLLPSTKYYRADGGVEHDMSQRITIGASGGYKHYDNGNGSGNGNFSTNSGGLFALAYVRAKLGRTQ